MTRDIHKSPFDEGTRAKLSIFQDYLKEWLPVFLAKKEIYWNTINIYDFFAGPGSDSHGVKGTPLIIIDELKTYCDTIIQKNLNVKLYFNEYKKEKYEELRERLFQNQQHLKPYTISVETSDFKDAFDRHYPAMGTKDCANLLFLDQTGVKHISEEVFQKIINLKRTDFLFFISSSTIKRFSEHPNIAQHIKLSPQEVERTPYHKIHRLILDYYRTLIPSNKEYYLGSFSLKKNSGVYGLIFGSGHVLGIQKFLSTCWSVDPERGEANFDIDDDRIIPGQGNLFTGEVQKPKKVDLFERELADKILRGELRTDRDIYLYTLSNGFLPTHTRRVINKLTSEDKMKHCVLNLTSKVCSRGATLTKVTLRSRNGTI